MRKALERLSAFSKTNKYRISIKKAPCFLKKQGAFILSVNPLPTHLNLKKNAKEHLQKNLNFYLASHEAFLFFT